MLQTKGGQLISRKIFTNVFASFRHTDSSIPQVCRKPLVAKEQAKLS